MNAKGTATPSGSARPLRGSEVADMLAKRFLAASGLGSQRRYDGA
jgi:hypothetical protein